MISVRTIIAVVVGFVVGSVVNMGLIMLGPTIIPVPEGVDVTDSESIANAMHLFQPKHFVFPFLAHAGGTLIGATVGHLAAASHRNIVAYVIGALFFAGGIAAASMIPAPVWFTATDLVLSYFPMAFIATFIGNKLRSQQVQSGME